MGLNEKGVKATEVIVALTPFVIAYLAWGVCSWSDLPSTRGFIPLGFRVSPHSMWW